MTMSRSTETSYLKIGSFALIGIFFIILALIVFGGSQLFQRTAYVETYFDESVQGISLGSPVKYRGLQIGYVKEIAFVSEIYEEAKTNIKKHSRYIYVKLAITSRFYTQLTDEEMTEFLKKEIAQGLRIKLTPQGLTGTAYLELNYVDPKSFPPMAIQWQPKHYYIPSSTSTITQFVDNVQYVFDELKHVDVKRLFENISALAASAHSLSDHADKLLRRLGQPLQETSLNLKIISQNLRMLSEQLKIYPAQVLSRPPPQVDPSRL